MAWLDKESPHSHSQAPKGTWKNKQNKVGTFDISGDSIGGGGHDFEE